MNSLDGPTWREWLEEADAAIDDDDVSDEELDDVLLDGADLDFPANPPSGEDAQRAQRIVSVLQARRAALAVELSDLSRRRLELTRARTGANGYLNSSNSVPMH